MGQEKNEDRKTRKSRRESGGFQFSLPIPRKETGGSHQGGIRQVIDQPTWSITQGASIIEGWEAKQDDERLPDTCTHNKNDTIVDPLAPNK